MRTAHEATGGRDHRLLRRVTQGLAALVLAAGGLVLAAPGASAEVHLIPGPAFPDPVTVGQRDLPATLSINNDSFGQEADPAGSVNVTTITLVPSCGTNNLSGSCPDAAADPGVFQLSPTGVGEEGGPCAGLVFTISPIDPTGKVRFTPNGPVILGSPGSPAATCVIHFTFDVLMMPTRDANPGAPGISTFQFGFAAGTSSFTGAPGFGAAGDETQVLPQAEGVPLVAPPVAAVVLGPLALAGGLVLFRRRRRPV